MRNDNRLAGGEYGRHRQREVEIRTFGLDEPSRTDRTWRIARPVKAATRMPVIAVRLITDFEQAEAIIGTGDADLIALARAILFNPRWSWHAAAHFAAQVRGPDQYLRSQPRQYRDLFDIRALIRTTRSAAASVLRPPPRVLGQQEPHRAWEGERYHGK